MTDPATTVRTVITQIAPDVDPAALTPETRLQEDLELDSMDVLNVMAALSDELGFEIPETDYRKLASVGGATDYVAART